MTFGKGTFQGTLRAFYSIEALTAPTLSSYSNALRIG